MFDLKGWLFCPPDDAGLSGPILYSLGSRLFVFSKFHNFRLNLKHGLLFSFHWEQEGSQLRPSKGSSEDKYAGLQINTPRELLCCVIISMQCKQMSVTLNSYQIASSRMCFSSNVNFLLKNSLQSHRALSKKILLWTCPEQIPSGG